MYLCKTLPITASKTKRVLSEAYSFIKEWRGQSRGSRPYVRVNFLKGHQRVFIDDFHYHIEKKELPDRVERFRLLPCVKELLKNTRDEPRITRDGNLMLEGTTPTGDQFAVIIRPEKKGGCLQTFYRVKK